MWQFLAGGGKEQVGEGKRKRYLCRWLGDEWHNTGQIVLNIPKLHLPSAAAPSLQLFPHRWGGNPGAILPPVTKPLHWELKAPMLPRDEFQPQPSCQYCACIVHSRLWTCTVLTLRCSYKINETFELVTVHFYRVSVSKTWALMGFKWS